MDFSLIKSNYFLLLLKCLKWAERFHQPKRREIWAALFGQDRRISAQFLRDLKTLSNQL